MAEVRLPRGILVVFEGIDGAGKTTQAHRLRDRLAAAGLSVVLSKEPTNGPHGQRIRATAKEGRLDGAEELRLFLDDRRQHVDELIAPALRAGQVVILDRYYFSTAAYQGARGLDPAAIIAENEAFAPAPDLLVLLDVPIDVGLSRIRERGDGDGNLFERRDNLVACAAIFAGLRRPGLLRLDGTQPADAVHERIVTAFDAGPLFDRLCQRDGLVACEPERCRVRLEGRCAYPGFGSLRPPPGVDLGHLDGLGRARDLVDRFRAFLRTVPSVLD